MDRSYINSFWKEVFFNFPTKSAIYGLFSNQPERFRSNDEEIWLNTWAEIMLLLNEAVEE